MWHHRKITGVVFIMLLVPLLGQTGPCGLGDDTGVDPVGSGDSILVGPAGPQGPPGPQGEPGLVIDDPIEVAEFLSTDEDFLETVTGPQGPQGEPGLVIDDPIEVANHLSTDEDFLALVTGPEGPQGEEGLQGEDGPQGQDGLQGDQGEAGPPGEAGQNGVQGETGPQGETGATGATGQQGPQGETGATGQQGQQGQTGATGATGQQGQTGATGATGQQGQTGATGATGADGEDGVTHHGNLTGLGNDDHPQYLRNEGVDTFSGRLDIQRVSGSRFIDFRESNGTLLGKIRIAGGDEFQITSAEGSLYISSASNRIFCTSESGNDLIQIDAQAFNVGSSRAYKRDIVRLTESDDRSWLETLAKTKPSTYYMKNAPSGAKRKLGLIADELPPELLSPEGDAVDLYALTTSLLSAMQALKVQVDEQALLMDELRKQLANR